MAIHLIGTNSVGQMSAFRPLAPKMSPPSENGLRVTENSSTTGRLSTKRPSATLMSLPVLSSGMLNGSPEKYALEDARSAMIASIRVWNVLVWCFLTRPMQPSRNIHKCSSFASANTTSTRPSLNAGCSKLPSRQKVASDSMMNFRRPAVCRGSARMSRAFCFALSTNCCMEGTPYIMMKAVRAPPEVPAQRKYGFRATPSSDKHCAAPSS
mmetsp:Transcript_22082/g.65916  ORF Transcript_22082/g.65916 Transcript_22082/m.65916 type:complete len:211 (-) Transcript_22082:549-1181(-)